MNLLDVSKSEIESFLKKNGRKMADPEFYYSVDNNQDPVENFTKDRLKVLVVFLSPGKNRAVSNTFNALNHLAHEISGDKVFVDCCYFPDDKNMEMMKNSNIPFIFGNTSHETMKQYDVVFMSCAIIPECLNIPYILEYSGVPLTIQERDKNNDLPLIIYGGAAANELAIVMGEIKRQGVSIGKSLVDVANYGYGEVNIPKLVEYLCDRKEEEFNLKDKPSLKERMISDKFLYDYLFYPEYYEWVYDESDKFTIKEIKCLDPRLPKRVKYNRIHDSNYKGFPLKTFNLNGENADSHDVMISSGCTGEGTACSFCMEGTVSGYYRERELKDIVEDMEYIIRTSAPNTISYYSYNLNYYRSFMDLLAEGANHFSATTLLNERMDVVAYAPDQLALAKRLGLKRFSGAIEGMGDRVRNQILNKNLPRETLMKACRVVYSLRLMHMKNGMIMTGQETEEDILDFIDEIDEMLKIKAEMGANTSLQFNVTPLVFYSQIALRYLPRKTAEMSYKKERTMQTLIKACQERSIRIKFNGRGCGTWIEQLLLDYGPAGTDWLTAVSIDRDMIYLRNFGDKDQVKATEELQRRGYDPLFFTKARPLDWIFPNDHIEYASEQLIQQWRDRTEQMNFDTALCLKTPASQHPKCSGCGMCKTPEEIKKMVGRNLYDEHTVDQVIEMFSDNRHVESVRIVAKVKPDWYFYNRDPMSHYITAQFLKRDKRLEKSFYALGKNTTTWLSSNGQKGWFGGTFAFDVKLKERVPSELFEKYINEINSELKSCEVVRVLPETKALPMKIGSDIACLGKTAAYSMSQIKDKLSNFNWDVKIAVKSMGGGLDLEPKHMPELKEKVLFVQNGREVLIYTSLPANINPYLLMASIIGKGYEKILDEFQFNVLDQGIETDATCKCGRHLTYSQFTGKNESVCQICKGKLVLKRLSS